MRVKELIKALERHLEDFGNSAVYISVDTGNVHELQVSPTLDEKADAYVMYTTTNLVTSSDNTEGDTWEFGIRNWLL